MVYASQTSETIGEDIFGTLKSDCAKKEECLEYFKCKIEDSSRAIKESSPKKALSDMDDKIAENDNFRKNQRENVKIVLRTFTRS